MTDEDARNEAPDGQPLFGPPWPTARPAEPLYVPPEAVHAPPGAPLRVTLDPVAVQRAPKSRRPAAMLAIVSAVALVAGAAGATVGIAVSERSSTEPATSSFVPPGATDNGGSSSGGGLMPGGFGSGSDSGSSGTSVDINVDAIASKVNPAVVNIATTLSGGQQTAGSGMVLTPSGEVLTNNHVINGATNIEVQIGVTGKTYTAKVLGYDVEDDVALIKLNNASGMKTITTASSSSVSTNDPVVAIGNALGQFGTPSAVGGTVSALHQQITAGDGLDEETLRDMIRIAAEIQPGDSGGALVNDSGKVIGMNTAADAGSGRFGYQAGTTGFAIPIENALKIVDEIKDGDSSNGAHIGDRALLGVVLGTDDGRGRGSGAAVSDVGSDTPAEAAGLEAGDTITAVDRHNVSSIDDLRSVLDEYHPGDKVTISWTDSSGDDHQARVTLTKGPPA